MMTYIDRANKVTTPRQYIREQETKQDSEDPGADKSFYSLLGRKLDQWGSAKCHTADVGKDVVDNDQCCRQEEPDHAFEDVVHDEMRLDYDED